MQYSKYQLDIFNAIKENNNNIIIQAVAGGAKTFSLIKSIDYIPNNKKILFVAFNNEIVREIERKIKNPNKVTVKTLHALGYGILKSGGYMRTSLVKDKTSRMMSLLQKKEELEKVSIYTDTICTNYLQVLQLVSLLKNNGVIPTQENFMDICIKLIDIYQINALSLKSNEEVEPEVEAEEQGKFIELCRKILDMSINERSIIDFDDMVYLPVIKHMKARKRYDYIFIDEAQDVSDVQRKLIRNIRNGARIVATGDKFQSIYLFRGAAHNSMDLLKKDFDCMEMPLSITYRCARNITKEAQAIVPQIKHRKDAPSGKIVKINDVNEYKPTIGDMVLCRNNAPLIKILSYCFKNNIPFNFNNKEIITRAKKKLKVFAEREFEGNELQEFLENRKKKELFYLKTQRRDDSDTRDLYNMLLSLIEEFSLETIDVLLYSLDKIAVVPKVPHVSISSIHKAKGLEADRVVFFRYDIVDANLEKYVNNKESYEQELNLKYVAITRARNTLVYLGDKEAKKEAC